MIRKLFASLFLLIFTLVFVPALVVFSFYNSVLKPEFFEEKLVDAFYTFLTVDFPGELVEGRPEDFARVVEAVIGRDDLREVVRQIRTDLENLTVTEDGKVALDIPLGFLNEKQDLVEDALQEEGFEWKEMTRPTGGNIEDMVISFQVSENLAGKKIFNVINALVRSVFALLFLLMFVCLVLIGVLIWKPGWKIVQWLSGAIFLPSTFLMLFAALFYFSPAILLAQGAPVSVTGYYELLVGTFATALFGYTLPFFVLSGVFWVYALLKNKPVSQES